ncbi:MAG: energy-coupling factor transporter transmembrane protein EcfT, partial [Candidatus Nanopelagicales bacterium]
MTAPTVTSGTSHATVPNLARDDRARWLHPLAWWAWALGVAVAASMTTNPLLLLGLITCTAVVVDRRRSDAPWARSFGFFLRLALIVVAFRLIAQILFVAPMGTTVLLELPGITLPSWLAGIRLGGTLMLEPALHALYEGLRLAAIIVAVGAASSLASPHRLLKSIPAAVYEVGVSVVVATTFLPQLASDVARIRANRRLRGRTDSGLRGVGGTVMPVLHGAMDRSIALAAAMDSRGYGRSATVSRARSRLTATVFIVGLAAIAIGTYGVLGTGSVATWGAGILIAGVVCVVVGVSLAGRRSLRTRYRPNTWHRPDVLTALAGGVVAATFVIASVQDPAGMNPSTSPPLWPTLPVLA